MLDFGLAKVTEKQMRPGSMILTREGMVFGTPEFMSPEQAQGKSLEPNSDVYSLGVILYELLTGKLPFDAKQPLEFIQLHVNAKPIPLSERVAGMTFPPGLEAAVMKTMEKRPEDRYTTAQEFADALDRVANPVIATNSPAQVQAWSSGAGTAIHQAEPPHLPANYVLTDSVFRRILIM